MKKYRQLITKDRVKGFELLLLLSISSFLVWGMASLGSQAVSIFALLSALLTFALVFSFLIFEGSKELIEDASKLFPRADSSQIRRWIAKHREDVFFFSLVVALTILFCSQSFADVRIPGTDESAKLKAAGTLLMLIDTALFVWLARILAGICIFTAGWLIKEQKLGPAIVCVLGALLIGTSPMWVQNIFEIGGGGGVFGK